MNSIIGQKKRHISARNHKRLRLETARRLQTERLETRVLLAGDTMAWHNADLPMDVNVDGRVTSRDALVVMNDLNASGSRDVDASLTPRGMIDVTGDGVVSARDSLEIINHLNSGSGESHEKVRVRLAVTGTNGLTPLDTIGPNEDFLLRAFVTDLTDPAEGVFGAYVDVTFAANLADSNGEIVHGDLFGNGVAGDVSVDGVLDELGSFAGSFSGTGDTEALLFSVPMTSSSELGTLTFSGDPADVLPNHETTLFGEDDAVLPDEILFAGTSVRIISADAPTAQNDSYNGTEDTTLTVDAAGGVLTNDLPDGAGLTASLISNASSGTVTLNADGSFTYEPNDNFNGQDSFTYVASNVALNSNVATVTLLVSAVNDAPIAVGDFYTTAVAETLSPSAGAGLLANDIDFEIFVPGNFVNVDTNQIEGVDNGTLTVNADGSFEYIPNEGFTGTETFTYVATDGELSSDPATVSITVTDSVGDGPEANDDSFSVVEDNTLEIAAPGVLANDVGGGETLTATLITQPANGTVSLNSDGSFQYMPNSNFDATDTFTYQVNEGLRSDTASVTIAVTPENDPPVTEDETYVVQFDTPLVVSAASGVLANDFDPDGDDVTATVVSEPSNGTLVLESDGAFTYVPNDGYVGIDSFIYALPDGALSRFATATLDVQPEDASSALVRVRVAATNASGDELTSIQSGESFELRVYVDDLSPEPQQGVFAAYTDVVWNSALAVVSGPIVHADAYPNGKSGDISTPGLLDEVGAFDGLTELGGAEQLLFSVPMQATSGGEITFEANPADDLPFGDILLFVTREAAVPTNRVEYGSTTLTVQGLSEPVAVSDVYDVSDGTLTVSAVDGVLTNDLRVDGDSLSAVLVDSPDSGTLQLSADGSFTYTANSGFIGTDSFTYRAEADDATSDTATVTLTVGDPTPSSLAGSIYFDTNNDGVRESHEHAFGGVNVTLTGSDIFGSSIRRTVATATDGSYSFTNLMAGQYVVTQTQPAIVIDGIDSRDGVVSTTNDSFSVDLSSGSDLSDLNFGERGLEPAYFGNRLFFSTTVRGGASVGIGPEGSSSWYCLDSGWDSFRAVEASLSANGSFVTITATAFNGSVSAATVPVSNPNVRVIGNTAGSGRLVRLTGSSADYALQPIANAEAVDAVFAE